MTPVDAAAKSFYDREYRGHRYAKSRAGEDHPLYPFLKSAVDTYSLRDKRCLEIGCGRGALQDLVEDYTGVDITESVRPFLRKAFVLASATELPFADNSFDALWTYAVLEHVPNPEKALEEIRRVLRPGGIAILSVAWHCPFYAAEGLVVRPMHDFNLRGKLRKVLAHLHRSAPYRAISIVLLRSFILARHLLHRNPPLLHVGHLTPNYDHFWMSDSDAVVSMDQLETLLWFTRRGDSCLRPASWLKRYLQTDGEIVIRIAKTFL